jgi:hypothetical protein
MVRKFDSQTLDALRTAEEVGIRTSRHPDRAIIIWIVASGGDAFIRSVRGAKAQWYIAAATDGRAMLDLGDRQIAVRVVPVSDPEMIASASKAYLAKYATSPYAKEMIRAEVLPTTLRLEPV